MNAKELIEEYLGDFSFEQVDDKFVATFDDDEEFMRAYNELDEIDELELTDMTLDEDKMYAVYENDEVTVTAESLFDEDTYTITIEDN